MCFTNLPCEIRLMIWHACFESRVVTICAQRGYTWMSQRPAISSVHSTMPITLSINWESRHETLLNYPDLIQNPELFRDRVYFNPKLDKLAVHVIDDIRITGDLPSLYHRGRKWRMMARQCLCHVFKTLSDLAKHSQSMCKMVRFLISYQGVFCRLCQNYAFTAFSHFESMDVFHELKTIVHQSPNVNESLVLEKISRQGSWTVEHLMLTAMTSSDPSSNLERVSTVIFEDDNWRVTQTDDHNVIPLALKTPP